MKKATIFTILLVLGCNEGIIWMDEDERALVDVCVLTEEDRSMCGTGFFISENQLMTAQHVIDLRRTEDPWRVKNSDGELLSVLHSKENKKYDMAVLTVLRDDTEKEPVWFDFCKDVNLFDDVITPSYRRGELQIAKGKVIIAEFVKPRGYIALGSESKLGWSGSPILGAEVGCVKGMNIGYSEDNYAVGPSVNLLRSFLDGTPRDSVPTEINYNQN